MLALPAKAIVKLRPGSVFEALQSCCLAFCNVLLVWLAPGVLLALPRPRVIQAQSKKQPRSMPGAGQEQGRRKPGASKDQRQKQSQGKPVASQEQPGQARRKQRASQEQARSQPGAPGAHQARQASKPGAGQEQARSTPGAGQERATLAIHCKMQGNSSARLQKHCQGATLRLLSLAGPTRNLQS